MEVSKPMTTFVRFFLPFRSFMRRHLTHSTGLKATFCPWFVYGKQQERLRNPSLQGYERINNDCLIYAGAQYCCGLSWVYVSPNLTSPHSYDPVTSPQWILFHFSFFPCFFCQSIILTEPLNSLQFIKRGELREQYGIKGDQLTDCLYSACCHCCVLIQQDKEIVHRQVAAGQTQGYVAPQGMKAAPQ